MIYQFEIIIQFQIHFLHDLYFKTIITNNPVNSTFRSLLSDYTFDENHSYKRGTPFLIINNPVLRDSIAFPNPNAFEPSRWNETLENSPYSIMFNRGPQICPGKDFITSLLSVMVIEYFNRVGDTKFVVEPELDVNNVPQIINPCTIHVGLK